MASMGITAPCCPVDYYEAQTHNHEGDAQGSKTESHYLRNGAQGFILLGNDAEVEDSREDENEAGSRRCANDAEDAQNVRSKYHQHVD